MRENALKKIYEVTMNEEAANAGTHIIMSLLCLIALPITAVYSYNIGGTERAVGTSIFIICLFLMFTGSAFYHITPFHTQQKFIGRIFDHIFIYFAIAGTYTPIALCLIKGWEGLLILIIQWTTVLIGIFYKIFAKKSMPIISVGIYLIMGWSAVFFLPTLLKNASPLFLGLIVLGGVLYSIGVYFYSKKEKKYYHAIWHIFINLASISHFIAVVFYM